MKTPPRQLRIFVLAGVAWLPAAVAPADTVSVNGIAISDVEVLAVRDGALVYLTASGAEPATPLASVQHVWIDRYPAYRQAVEKIEAGKPAAAVPLLLGVIKGAARDEPWVKQLATRRLVQAYDAAGRGARAAAGFVDLVKLKPDPFFLAEPPVKSVGQLAGESRTRAAALIDRALRNATDDARPPLQTLADLLAPEPEPDAPAPQSPAEQQTPPKTAPQTPTPPATSTTTAATTTAAPGATEASAVVLPATIANLDDPAVALLRRGKFAEALRTVDQQLAKSRTRLQQRLYLRGLALLGVADASHKRDDYLDAGLAFMRVVTLAGPGSSYLGPALLEAAYVHQQIDAPEVANELFEEAGLLLDEEDEPDYYQRYQQLRGQ